MVNSRTVMLNKEDSFFSLGSGHNGWIWDETGITSECSARGQQAAVKKLGRRDRGGAKEWREEEKDEGCGKTP